MLLLLLATMPVVWTDGGNMKLYSDDRGFLVRPGFKKPGKSKDRVNRTDEVARLADRRLACGAWRPRITARRLACGAAGERTERLKFRDGHPGRAYAGGAC